MTVLSFVLSLANPANAIDQNTLWTIGAEGGLSTFHESSQFGGQLALRTSLYQAEWGAHFQHLGPQQWRGGYARFEANSQDYRAVLGYGHSTISSMIGLEYGLLLSSGHHQGFGYGAECTLHWTLGVVGAYLRESLVKDGDLSWQTDIGLRLQFPIRGQY